MIIISVSLTQLYCSFAIEQQPMVPKPPDRYSNHVNSKSLSPHRFPRNLSTISYLFGVSTTPAEFCKYIADSILACRYTCMKLTDLS